MARDLPDLFSYLDYRVFLSDTYEQFKGSQRGFSYRSFAKKAGMASPNFLKLVIDGKRNLGAKSIEQFANALELSTREREFFRTLVAFNQAKTSSDKNAAFEKLAGDRRHRRVRKLDRALFEYLSHWYYPAIRELALCKGFREDPAWIASHLVPNVSIAQAQHAVDVLLRLGLLERDARGHIVQGDALLSTGPELRSLAVRNFHRQMIGRASGALDEIEMDKREISGTTVALDVEGFALFKEKIHALRAELLELSAACTGATRVLQFNFQAFPLALVEE